MKKLQVLLLSWLMLPFSFVWSETSPVPMLEQSAQQILHTLKQNQSKLKTNHQIIQQAIQQHLLPHVDVTGMARSVLGRQAWAKASSQEKQEFTQAFTQLVIRTYASPLAEYSGETIHFVPLRQPVTQSRFVRVNSVISRPNGQKIPLSYQLVLKNNQWKIYDLNVEGVSLLQSFHSQFADALRQGSMQALIAQMRKPKKVA